ncbi:hypothetical protein HCG69_03350 [Bacteroides sp. K03]|uniref:hypothetical protein n=1 Tax=unclassified Bacteroides TaxID=2646097 RepID=UPI001C8C361B|nr:MULTISPECIES: hypothetical protein [unclassified Bacteroides]MBX9187128.1 hypothetical protein [Bacteroides sp. K03]
MNFKTYITSTLLSCFLLTGCNSDNEKLIYESDTNCYVSFRTEKLNKEIEKDENNLIIPVYRENKQGIMTVIAELLFQQNPDGTEVPGREFISLENNIIEFKDGENISNIILNINLSQLDYLTKAKAQIKLRATETAPFSTFGKTALTLSLNRKPTWKQFEEKGIYTSGFLNTEKEVTILKAEEAPFYIIKDCYVANGDIRVDMDNDGNVTIEQQKAFRLEAYGIVYVVGTGFLDKTTNTVIMQLTFLVEQDGQWGILSGAAFEEKFTIPAR